MNSIQRISVLALGKLLFYSKVSPVRWAFEGLRADIGRTKLPQLVPAQPLAYSETLGPF